MLTIGVDAHKQLLVAVSIDQAGREGDRIECPNSPTGWQQMLDWAANQCSARQWGIEGSGGLGRGCAQFLVQTGETVYEVNSRLTAQLRGRNRRRDKSDRWDGLAIARAVQRDQLELPHVYPVDRTSIASQLTRERDDLVADQTSLRNRLHQQLHQVDPAFAARWKSHLRNGNDLAQLQAVLPVATNELETIMLAGIQRMLTRMLLNADHIDELTQELQAEGKQHYVALTEMDGVSYLTAAMLAGHLGPAERFASDAKLAAYSGVAPLEASSAGGDRHRLNRSGNRQLNAVAYRIAVTQERLPKSEGYAYLQRKRAAGKTRLEAIRALKRFIIRRIWQMWTRMHTSQPLPLT